MIDYELSIFIDYKYFNYIGKFMFNINKTIQDLNHSLKNSLKIMNGDKADLQEILVTVASKYLKLAPKWEKQGGRCNY